MNLADFQDGFDPTLRPTRTTVLDLSKFQSPGLHRVQVLIVRDGLGAGVRVPVLVLRGTKPGPVLALNAALHGNELNGIPVIHRVLGKLSPTKLSGTLLAVLVANVPGFLRHQRVYSEGSDLNHLFPGNPKGKEAEVYANRLYARVISKADYLVDLHTASFGRINSYYIRADTTNAATRSMAERMRPQIILRDPASTRTLRGIASADGIPSITLELRDPQRFQSDVVRRTATGVRAVMKDLGMLQTKPQRQDFPKPTHCSQSIWLYTDTGGLLEVLPDVASFVTQGEVIARLTTVYGDLLREYRAPRDGVVIGKSSNPVAQTGARILHLGDVVDG